jgi:hypothetical protein
MLFKAKPEPQRELAVEAKVFYHFSRRRTPFQNLSATFKIFHAL